MKKYGLYVITTLAVLFAGTSCEKDKEDHTQVWMTANQIAFSAIKADPEYRELKSSGNEGSIYYKVITKGEGTNPIYYTSAITCYYKGWFVADYPQYGIKKGTIFQQKLFDNSTPVTFAVNDKSLGKGWKTALQHMVKGDKWEIWIPYQLGYGREKSGSIPGYSTLVFEIEIVTVDGQ
jgi:peptidylprolyl isomerase/FKBP-type peptidyl-prolyl cis-trans isomerase FklB